MAFEVVKHLFTTEIYFIDYDTSDHLDYGKCLTSIAIKKDYVSNVFPLYVLGLRITKEQKEYLATHNFYISLKIYRCQSVDDSESNNIDANMPITDKEVVSTLLMPFDPSKVISKNINTSVDENNTDKDKQLVDYTINCVPKEELKINNSIINNCYENANIDEIILNMLSEVYTKDIYYQESNNIERFNSVIIPPMGVVPALRYLQDKYLIYTYKLNMFFDSSKLFIYDIVDTTRKFNNSFFIEIAESSDEQNQSKYTANYIDENENVKKFFKNNLPFVSYKDVYRYTTGDNVVFNSYDDNFNLISRNYELSDSKNIGQDKKVRYLWNANKKQDFESKIMPKLYYNTTVTLKNIDPSLFMPDTIVYISGSSNTDYNGQFSLLTSEIFMSSTDFTNFNSSITLGLQKL